MKIGIVVHSQSGTTANVARKLNDAFTEKGHDVDLKLLRTSGKVAPRSKSFELRSPPAIEHCDLVILGAPVWAFTASPVIMKYIAQLGCLSGKKVFCFVTKGLPFAWTGGSRALKSMEEGLAVSDAGLLPGVMIHTFTTRNESKIAPLVARIVDTCTG